VRTYVIKKADVVHLNSLNVKLAKIAKNLNKPVIAVLHGAPFPKEAYDAINDYIDVYIAPSNFTKIHEEPKIGSKKIVVIYHGIDTELFNTNIPREIASAGLPRGRVRSGDFGREWLELAQALLKVWIHDIAVDILEQELRPMLLRSLASGTEFST
jgi:glycosyltransferase involved in cell wall biosynthesis